MATYNVYMGQGVLIPDLRGNMLVTGAGGNENDAVQSCSAIVFFNTNTKSAGLYHFPAGDITQYNNSQLTIGRMALRVGSPIQITIAVGKFSRQTDQGAPLPDYSPSVMNTEKLRSFIHGNILHSLPDGRLRLQTATTGIVTAMCDANGNLVIGSQNPMNFTDLGNDAEGNHGPYITYGFANRAG